jgi:hypothetical protein
MKMTAAAYIALLLMLPSNTTSAAKPPSPGIARLHRLDLLPRFKDSVFVGSVSSYDRTGDHLPSEAMLNEVRRGGRENATSSWFALLRCSGGRTGPTKWPVASATARALASPSPPDDQNSRQEEIFGRPQLPVCRLSAAFSVLFGAEIEHENGISNG